MKHEHDFIIYESYQDYAVCTKCGIHDWGDYDDDGEPVTNFEKKYPKAKVVDLIELQREAESV